MISFFLHFAPLLVVSCIVLIFLKKRYGVFRGAFRIKTIVAILTACFAYRSFVIAMWLISPAGLLTYVAAIVFSMYKTKKIKREVPYHIVIKLVMFFPMYLFVAIFIFSVSLGHDCKKMSAQKGFEPVYSFCDQKNVKSAKSMTNNVYHCRNAFMGSVKNIVYVAFGAETNNKKQVLLGIDRVSRKIVNKIYTYTVFRGYCDPELKICLHIVTPRNTFQLWDDDKQIIINKFINKGKRRPRFISVDTKEKKVYILYDGAYMQVVDLKKSAEQRSIVIEKKITIPSNALATIATTEKRVAVTSSLFFHPYIYVVDKNSDKVSTISVGRSNVLTSLGMYFHLAGDPERERVFVGAPFEGGVFMVDLDKKKTIWHQKLPVGIRCVAYDSRRKMLYASNFVNGYVYVIDVSGDNHKLIGKIFTGRRTRLFQYVEEEDIFIFASSNGFYIFNPEIGLKNLMH